MFRAVAGAGVAAIVLTMVPPTNAWAIEHTVDTVTDLRDALYAASGGDRIYVASGTYSSRLYVSGVHGAPGELIEVVALDPSDPPVFEYGGYGVFTLINCSYILVDGIVARGAGATTGEGNNIDIAQSHHMILMNSHSGRITVPGNSDGMKFASSSNTLMYNCTIEDWGSDGSGADMMNNHNSLFMRNTFTFPSLPNGTAANGIQSKGGNAYEVGVYKNVFDDGGNRAQKFGGWGGASEWEAYDMAAMGNVFVKGEAAVSFESSTRCEFAYNTVVNPEKWVMRILKGGANETAYDTFRRNLVVYGPFLPYGGVQNISAGTRPETFTYAENYWYNNVNPGASIPSLPGGETDPAGGIDPQFDAEYRPLYGPADEYGAHAAAMEAEFEQYVSWFQWAWDKAQQYDPDADAGGFYGVGPGLSVTFDAGGSYGGSGVRGTYTVGSYLWDLDGDNVFDDGAGPAVTVSYEDLTGAAPGQLGLGPGPHEVQVRIAVTNEYGTTIVDWDTAELLVLAELTPGDCRVDGVVNVLDLGVLASHYRQGGCGWRDGDFNGDGVVNVLDLGALANHYGSQATGREEAVPEPAMVGLLALGALALRRRRR